MENQNKSQAGASSQTPEIKKADGDSHLSQEKKAPAAHEESGNKTAEQQKQNNDHSKDQN